MTTRYTLYTAFFILDPISKGETERKRKKTRGDGEEKSPWVVSIDTKDREDFMFTLANDINEMDDLSLIRDILTESRLMIRAPASFDQLQPLESRWISEEIKAKYLRDGHPFRDVLLTNLNRGRHDYDRDRLIEALYPKEEQVAWKVRTAKEREMYLARGKRNLSPSQKMSLSATESLLIVIADLTVPVRGIENIEQIKRDISLDAFTRLLAQGANKNEKVTLTWRKVRAMTYTDYLPIPGVPGAYVESYDPISAMDYLQLGMNDPRVSEEMRTFLQTLSQL